MINGESFKVTNILENYESYSEYIVAKGYTYDFLRNPFDYYSYLEQLMKKDFPSLKQGTMEYDIKFQELFDTKALQFYDTLAEYEISPSPPRCLT